MGAVHVTVSLFELPNEVWAKKSKAAFNISLNGKWEAGTSKYQLKPATEPGIFFNPAEILKTEVWYRRTVRLPSGNWTNAALELN